MITGDDAPGRATHRPRQCQPHGDISGTSRLLSTPYSTTQAQKLGTKLSCVLPTKPCESPHCNVAALWYSYSSYLANAHTALKEIKPS